MTKVNEMSAFKYTGTGESSSSKGIAGDETSQAFMGLLLAQLRNQSPMDPMDDNQMISQMAQLNSLQELQSISTSIKGMTESNKFLSATGLIGKYAKYATLDEEGKAAVDDKSNVIMASGKVTSVSVDGNNLILTVGGKSISFSDLAEVSDTEISVTAAEDTQAS